MAVGLYVHIPFCARKCPYCDFYSQTGTPAVQEAYLELLCRQIREIKETVQADTLYFGGGTPVLAEPRLLGKVVQAAKEACGLAGEITLEANPGMVSPERLKQLADVGFNRISFGMQSAIEEELHLLGRAHSAKQAADAVAWAKQAGIENCSVDLMLGIPGQTQKSLVETLHFTEELDVSHVSAYLLKIEPGTPFDCEQIRASVPDEDLSSDLYLQACAGLEALGLKQYEISNFARPGKESRHNLKYWKREEYLGFGPSAHGFWQGKRYEYPRNLDAYFASGGKNAQEEDGAREADAAEETFMLGMRLTQGIDCAEFEAAFGISAKRLLDCAEQYCRYGLLKREGSRIWMTPQGFLVSNSLLANFLAKLF